MREKVKPTKQQMVQMEGARAAVVRPLDMIAKQEEEKEEEEAKKTEEKPEPLGIPYPRGKSRRLRDPKANKMN